MEAERADSISCGMEHAIGRDALDRPVCFLAFVGERREEGQSWLGEFRRFTREGTSGETGQECMQQYLHRVGTEEPGETP